MMMRSRLEELRLRLGGEEQCASLTEAIGQLQELAASRGAIGDRAGEYRALLLACWLQELRARRVAMGRDPDGEKYAAADMCCCNVNLQGAPARQFRDGCPLHPAPHLQPGWQPDDYEVVDSAGRQLTTFCSTDSCQAARYGGSDLCGGCGACTQLQAEHSGHIVRRLQQATPECTGVSARWCPVHGDCTCEPGGDADLDEPDCPLHGTASDHAEAPPDPEAIARRLMGELGPEVAAAVCVQLLGRLPRREPKITVCASCLRAACWQGELLCDDYQDADAVEMTREELTALDREHPSWWDICEVSGVAKGTCRCGACRERRRS